MPRHSELQLAEEQKRLLHLLRGHPARSRIEISRILNINNGSVTRLSRELISLGLIAEAEAQSAPRGRPSLPLHLRPEGAHAIGVTTHPGWVDICVLDFAGRQLAQQSRPWDEGAPEDFAQLLSREADAITAPLKLRHSRFLGFGISLPGYAVGAQSKRHTVERLRLWRNIDLARFFGEALEGPVWIENDANAAAIAEFYDLGDRAGASLLALFLGYGVGGGCITEGRLFSGEYGNAGEIGILYPLDQPRPSAVDLVNRLQADQKEPIDLFNLASYVERHPDAVDAWIDRAARQLEIAILSGIGWFDPATLVLSGPLPSSVLDPIAAKLNLVDWSEKLGSRTVPAIRASRLQGRAAAIGAAFLPIHHLMAP